MEEYKGYIKSEGVKKEKINNEWRKKNQQAAWVKSS